MTELEQETFQDGFRVCLLMVNCDRRRDALEYSAKLYEGGRPVSEERCAGPRLVRSPDFLTPLRGLLMQVLASPHVLAVYGAGSTDLVGQCLPRQVSPELRVLDLRRTAVRLDAGLSAGCRHDELLRAYGVSAATDAGSGIDPGGEDLLWAVIGRAGVAGMSWPGLLSLADESAADVSFDHYAFTEETIAAFPEAPGVYVMRDVEGGVLYVGKAASLARRLRDYFRPSHEVPDKLRRIRRRVRDIEFRAVGSELEALLLEAELISTLQPDLNVARNVAEGRSRYSFRLGTVAVMNPSVATGRVEVFLFGTDIPCATQLRVDPERPPRKQLESLLRYYGNASASFRRGRSVRNWGSEGNEICCRYFARFKDGLQWLAVEHAGTAGYTVDAMLKVVAVVAKKSPDPGEFRSSAG